MWSFGFFDPQSYSRSMTRFLSSLILVTVALIAALMGMIIILLLFPSFAEWISNQLGNGLLSRLMQYLY
jgi:hypothetical protein